MSSKGRRYLYEVVHSALKEEILDGTYPCNVILPSEREISLRFNVDRTTVRKALDFLVTDGLVEKRAGVGTKVIYKANGQRGPGDGKMVGFFIVEDETANKKISQPFYSDLFYQMEDQCKRHNANILYSTIKNDDDLISMISQRYFSGVIFASKTEESYVRIVQESGIRVAQILGYNHCGLSICYDSSTAGFIATNHLIENGHRSIALITGPMDFQTSKDRLSGVLLSLYEHGLVLKKSHVFEGNWEYETGYQCAMQILSITQDKPTAIYCFNDMMTMGAMQAISDAGLKIPRDISLISTDNMSKIKANELELTTIDANIPDLAEAAANYFFSTETNHMTGMKIIIPVTFVNGGTVRNLNMPL